MKSNLIQKTIAILVFSTFIAAPLFANLPPQTETASVNPGIKANAESAVVEQTPTPEATGGLDAVIKSDKKAIAKSEPTSNPTAAPDSENSGPGIYGQIRANVQQAYENFRENVRGAMLDQQFVEIQERQRRWVREMNRSIDTMMNNRSLLEHGESLQVSNTNLIIKCAYISYDGMASFYEIYRNGRRITTLKVAHDPNGRRNPNIDLPPPPIITFVEPDLKYGYQYQ